LLKGVKVVWVLILILNGTTPMSVDFDTEWACKDAGRKIVDSVGEKKAVYWCLQSSQ